MREEEAKIEAAEKRRLKKLGGFIADDGDGAEGAGGSSGGAGPTGGGGSSGSGAAAQGTITTLLAAAPATSMLGNPARER